MNAAVGEQPTPPAPEPDTPGELLRRQREQRGLSVQHAAEELHLDTWAIEALEGNRFASLGAPVYAKGYLRKYALMLGASPEAVMARYEAMSDTPPAPVPVRTQHAPFERISLKKPLLIVGAVIVLALAAWAASWWLNREPEHAPASPTAIATPAPAETSAETSAPAVEPPAETAPAIAAPSAPVSDAPAAPESTERAPAANSGRQVRLRLEFSETSWTEVYDATGRRLMFGLGEPGRVRTLTGVPPLRVTLGAASAVSAQVNEQPIVIPRRAGRDASKFVIDASGNVAMNVAAASEQ